MHTTPETIRYSHIFDGSKIRPNACMHLSAHEEIAGILKTCKSEVFDWVLVRDLLDVVVSELNEWLLREYTRVELGQDTVREMYYGSLPRFRQGIPDYDSLLEGLSIVQDHLISSYPACEPLAELSLILDDAKQVVMEEQFRGTAPPRAAGRDCRACGLQLG